MDNTGQQSNTFPQTPQSNPTPTIPSSPWQTTPIPETQTPAEPMQPTLTPPIQPVSPWQSSPLAETSIPTATSWQSTPTPEPQTATPIAPPSPSVTAPANTMSAQAVTPVQDVVLPKRKKVPPVLVAGLAMFLVVGIAAGTFMISRGVSKEEPIAPNAPASKPKAFDPNEEAASAVKAVVTPPISEGFDPNGTIDCTNYPNTAPYGNRCVPTVKLSNGEVAWAPGALESLK